MNKKKLMAIVAGSILLVIILSLVILFGRPKQEGISRALVYKSAALLLTDAGICQKNLEEPGRNSIPEKDRNYWYAKYLNELYIRGIVNSETAPSDAQSVQGYMTYGEAKALLEALSPGFHKETDTEKSKQNTELPAAWWWSAYDKLRKEKDPDGQIRELDIFLYGTPMNLTSALPWTAYTSKGNFRFEGLQMDRYIDFELNIMVRDSEIIAVRNAVSDSVTYKNVWLLAAGKDSFSVHLGSAIREFPMEASYGPAEDFTNHLADLTLKKGKLTKVTLKKKVISGKVLSVKDDAIEIEGYGVLKLEKDFKVYKLYGQFKEQKRSDILVGYDLQEFVVAHGKLCAALTVREFDAKIIRVLLMNTNFKSIFHPSVTLSAKSGLILKSGEESTQVPPGAEVILYPEDERLKSGRIVVTPADTGDTISISSIRRSLGTPSYGGAVEIKKEAGGLTLINELYLEDYLAKVVPSEMPDRYEPEALKAQAVCARTYAYRQIRSNAYSQYGAHVDDSTRFQVYNNMKSSPKTEQAVRDTYGKMIFYQDTPIEAFYFSTSCGHTTDGSIWGSDPARYPYLDGCLLSDGRDVLNLSTNAAFEAFIKDKNYPSYDAAYPMYRWETTVTNQELQEEITAVGTILNLSVTERGVGGVVKQVRVEGDGGVTTIDGEAQVRAKLGNPYITITRNDGSVLKNVQSLPSSYIAIENEGVDDNNVTTFRIYGGGYGHGVGMSQNGAQTMASQGKTYEDILKFFYKGVEVREAETNEENENG